MAEPTIINVCVFVQFCIVWYMPENNTSYLIHMCTVYIQKCTAFFFWRNITTGIYTVCQDGSHIIFVGCSANVLQSQPQALEPDVVAYFDIFSLPQSNSEEWLHVRGMDVSFKIRKKCHQQWSFSSCKSNKRKVYWFDWKQNQKVKKCKSKFGVVQAPKVLSQSLWNYCWSLSSNVTVGKDNQKRSFLSAFFVLFHLVLSSILLTYCSLLITQKVVETASEEEKDDNDCDETRLKQTMTKKKKKKIIVWNSTGQQ